MNLTNCLIHGSTNEHDCPQCNGRLPKAGTAVGLCGPAIRGALNSPHPIGVADNGGLRFDDGKARYDLLGPEFLDALALHCGVGARKYADRNWERGMAWCKCFACLMRHAWKWMRGEDIDAETGTHHMIAAAWNCMALYTYAIRRIGTDDRPVTKAAA